METKSAHPLRRFWGWGLESDELLPTRTRDRPGRDGAPRHHGGARCRRPRLRQTSRCARRAIAPPPSLEDAFSDSPHDRLSHAYGKSFADSVRMWNRDVPNPPDWVAFPPDEQAVSRHPRLGGSRRMSRSCPMAAARACAAGSSRPSVRAIAPPCRSTSSDSTACSRWTAPADPPASRPGSSVPTSSATCARTGSRCGTIPQSFQFSTLGRLDRDALRRPLRHAPYAHRRVRAGRTDGRRPPA